MTKKAMPFGDFIKHWIDALDGDVVVPTEAQKLVAQAREKFPRQLADWLDERAEKVVGDVMGEMIRSDRAVSQRRRKSRQFADVAERVERGEDVDLSEFAARYVVDEGRTRRPLGSMTHDDIDFAASDYEQRSIANKFEASFLRAVQKRVPADGSTVSDHLTEEQLGALRKADA